MSYNLTLSKSERDAIDWVGDRYSNGNELRDAIEPYISHELEWDMDRDITFFLPEHVAWEVQDIAAVEEYHWPCFAHELRDKLQEFCAAIV